MTEPAVPNVYPSEAAAKKAGHAIVSKKHITSPAWLYKLQPLEGKASYLVSSATSLRVSERAWIEANNMTVTKLGRFHPNGCFLTVQKNMRRSTPDALSH
ncbi:hypothetical protein Q0M94_24325 (plasmid) [Deinococcus radiomollis]|uniref:hypothetical protein n=1 Tax=Deinococcus radiomollis TaxID=468916 RepID=UPI0038917FB5